MNVRHIAKFLGYGVSCRFIVAFLFVISATSSQAGDLKKIAKRIDKEDYEKAVELIQESLAEEPVNPGVRYYYAKLFLNDNFSKKNLDSARVYIFQAKEDLLKAGADVLDEMAKIPINEDSILTIFDRVSSLAFDRAIKRNTVQDLNTFLENFPQHPEKQVIIDARDRLIFEQVVNRSDIEGFEEFLTQYPESVFAVKAKVKLDSLVVLKHQNSDSITDLEEFIRANPDSEYVEDALGHLLRLNTISGKPESFLRFIQNYPNYETTQLPVDFLFHLDASQDFKLFERYVEVSSNPDSLRQERSLAATYFFPVYERTIQLISLQNQKVSTPFITLDQASLCEGVLSNFLSGQTSNGSGIYSISGSLIANGKLIKDLGAGFLLVESDNEKSIIHKSGKTILTDLTDGELLGEQFLKVQKAKTGLYSLLGEEIVSPVYDDFFIDGDFWFVQRNDLLAITSAQEITDSFGKGFNPKFDIEDYELLSDTTLIGFKGQQECILKKDGEFLVPWGDHQVFPSNDFGYVKSKVGYYFIDQPERIFNNIATSQSLVTYLTDTLWYLESKKINWKIGSRDSIRLVGNHMAIISGENPRVVFETGITKDLYPNDEPILLTGSGDHLLVKNGKVSSLYDSRGEQIIGGNFDRISLLADTLLAVSFKGKTGLYSPNGEELLPITYDHLEFRNGIISTLKDGKIGGYDVRNNITIKPKYEAKISTVGRSYLTRMNGKSGLIDRDGETVVPFDYEAITDWSDTLVWAKKGSEYHLLNLNDLVPERTVTLLSDFGLQGQLVKKSYGEKGFGLIGNKSGILLQPNFTDIRLIGTRDNQIIVGEQALPQAGYTVLTYFDSAGNKIHSQAYRPEEYENVLCDE